MEQLTVSQAIEQGYTSFFYASDGWQRVKYITSDKINWKKSDIFLAEKDPRHPSVPDAEELAELIAEQMAVNYADETGADDTDPVYYAIKAIDFSDVVERIRTELIKIDYYTQANIKLIPDGN